MMRTAVSTAAWVGVCASLALGAAGCAGAGPEDVNVGKAEYGLANDAFHKGRYREALGHVNTALDHDDENADAAYLGAMVMLMFCANDEASSDCRYDEAERFLRLALEADPDMRDAKNALGVVLVHSERAGEAIEVLAPLAKDILYRSPEKAWGNLGWAYLEADQTDQAIDALKRSVAAQPLFCVGHYRLGLAYEKEGEYAAARQALTRAVTIEEGDCGKLQAAFWARARVLARLSKEAEMREDLEKCQELAASTAIGQQCSRRLAALH
jgi:Tfp pilus assembly protein PilF